MSIKVGILNVTGYAGSELVRLLHGHPMAEIVAVTGRSAAGSKLRDVLPYYRNDDLTITSDIKVDVDAVFSALPHAASAEKLLPFINAGVPCIDLSADFRLDDVAIYEQWYKTKHPSPNLLGKTVYGLPEFNRKQIQTAKLAASPGCFPTGALLGLAPLLQHQLIEPWAIIDAKSGVSGAGRSAKLEFGFSELDGSVNAYGIGGHRHMPEMEQEAQKLFLSPISIRFTPHLVPMSRGILSTCYAKIADAQTAKLKTASSVLELYREFYADEPFVNVADAPPKTKFVTGSNHAFIYPHLDSENNVTIISAIDNLVKGAAGQAIQSFNLMMNIPETTGLEQNAVYP